MKARLWIPAAALMLVSTPGFAQDAMEGSIPSFEIAGSDIELARAARPDNYFDKTGRRFAILGTESGTFEAWAWPLKLFRDFSFEFFLGSSTQPIRARDIVERVEVSPAVTTITYVFQSFTVRAHFVTSVYEPGAVILLDVDSTEPLTIVAGFVPTMQPMWPAGLGGQYARWDENLRAYTISESSRKNHGFIGSPAASGMSYTPAHMLSDQPNQFRIEVKYPERLENRFIPIVMAGGPGDRTHITDVYRRLAGDPEAVYRTALEHFETLRQQTLRIHTPVRDLDLALEWAKIAYENLLVDNPHLDGTGLIAGLDRAGRGGRPGFGWFFGGDTYINALSLNALGHFDAAREAIVFMTQFQREDGKMAHEITQAVEYADWFGDYPYAYIHADTSPFFILAVYDYYLSTGDGSFVESQWDALQKAYGWSRSTDGNGDGLMDNNLAGLGALEFGALTGIQSDIYLGAVWIRATEAMSELARFMNDGPLSTLASTDHNRVRAAFEKYWDEDSGQYVYAFNEDGQNVQEITPWSAVGLMFGYGTDERARSSLLRMARADLTTDWGVRMLSTDSDYFEPLNYNYGAVWPFLTSWVSAAQFARGLPLQGYSGLMSTIQHVFNRSLGQVTEVFSGARHIWPQESVPHQGFCTAGTVLPLVRGLLGISTDASTGTLTLSPNVPGDWKSYSVENIRLGSGSAALAYTRSPGRLRMVVESNTEGDALITAAPALAPGTRVMAAFVNEQAVPFELEETGYVTRPVVSTTLADRTVIDFDLEPAFEIIPPVWDSNVGDANRGLRINSYHRAGNEARLVVEGISGETYHLKVLNAAEIASISGAEVGHTHLKIQIPTEKPGSYVRINIRFTFVE